MPDPLETIVQRMIDAGEPEEAIAGVIQHFKSAQTPPEEESTLHALGSAAKSFVTDPEFRKGFTKHLLTEEPATVGALGSLGVMGAGAVGVPAGIAGAASAAIPLVTDVMQRGSRYLTGKPQDPVSLGEAAEIASGPALQYGGPVIMKGARALRMMAPDTKRLIGGVIGGATAASRYGAPHAIEGAMAGAWAGPRTVDATSQGVKVAGQTVERVAQGLRGKTGLRFAAEVDPAVQAADEALRLKNLRDANVAQYKYEEEAAKQKLKGLRGANTAQYRYESGVEKQAATEAEAAASRAEKLQDQFETAASKQNLREVDAAAQAKDAAEELKRRDLREANTAQYRQGVQAEQQAAKEAEATKKAEMEAERAAKISAARGEPKKMVFRVTQSAPTPGGGKQSVTTTYRPRGAATTTEETSQVAPYTHHSTDKLPRFNVEGSDVTAEKAIERGYTPGEIPAGAGPESSTATRDAALARQAVRVQGQKAAAPASDLTGPSPFEAVNELNRPGAQKFMNEQFAKNNPIAQEVLGWERVGGPRPIKLDPKSVEALGGEMGPIAEAAYRRALGVQPGVKLDPEMVQALKNAADPIMSRTDAAKAGKALGLDANTVRGMRGGEAGIIAPDLMEVLDKAMEKMSLKEMVDYLNKAPNANVYKYIESQIKQKIPF